MDTEQGPTYYPPELKNRQSDFIHPLDVFNPSTVYKAVMHIIATDFYNHFMNWV